MQKCEKNTSILEISCGNGRDTIFFHKNKFKITAIDKSEYIIYKNIKIYGNQIEWISLSASKINKIESKFDNIYARFMLHSINEKKEQKMLMMCYDKLNNNGLLFIECRSINDELYGRGMKLENKHEYKYDHYRRFIDLDELELKLKNIGYTIVYKTESNNISILKDSNPTLIRIIAKKYNDMQ